MIQSFKESLLLVNYFQRLTTFRWTVWIIIKYHFKNHFWKLWRIVMKNSTLHCNQIWFKVRILCSVMFLFTLTQPLNVAWFETEMKHWIRTVKISNIPLCILWKKYIVLCKWVFKSKLIIWMEAEKNLYKLGNWSLEHLCTSISQTSIFNVYSAA